MSIQKMEANELLSINKFHVDEEDPHIVIDKAICATCQEKWCLYVCPAVLYKQEDNGNMSFDCAGCLECGTCRIVCKKRGIEKWVYPRGSFGVSFRFG